MWVCITYEIWNMLSALLEKVTKLILILLGLDEGDFQEYTHINVYMWTALSINRGYIFYKYLMTLSCLQNIRRRGKNEGWNEQKNFSLDSV